MHSFEVFVSYIIICFLIVIFFLFLLICSNEKIINCLRNIPQDFNKTLKEPYKKTSEGEKILYIIIASVFTLAIFLSAASCGNLWVAILATIIVDVIVFLVIVLFTYVVAKIFSIIEDINDKKDRLQTKIIFNSMLLSVLLFASELTITDADALTGITFVLIFLGVFISYIYNILFLLAFIKNKSHIISGYYSYKNKIKKFFYCSAYLVSMIIVNLYLIVVFTNKICDGSFVGVNGKIEKNWELFYYTIISFTTTGYGDISPRGFCGQLVSIIISITSVFCLVIFLGSVLSIPKEEKNHFLDDMLK